ncbi:MAG: hypothetical protein ACRELA_09905 [Candidatus Rokuibacteriota bacterium]
MDPNREPTFTRRLQVGFGLLAFGLGLMFLAGKVLPAPVPAGIASGIILAATGFVLVVVEAVRDSPPRPPSADPAGGETSRQDPR